MLQFSTSALACTTLSSVSMLLCSSSFVIVYIASIRRSNNSSYLDNNSLFLVFLLVLPQPILYGYIVLKIGQQQKAEMGKRILTKQFPFRCQRCQSCLRRVSLWALWADRRCARGLPWGVETHRSTRKSCWGRMESPRDRLYLPLISLILIEK